MLNKAIKKFGVQVSDAALNEMKQLLDCKCFVPIHRHSDTRRAEANYGVTIIPCAKA